MKGSKETCFPFVLELPLSRASESPPSLSIIVITLNEQRRLPRLYADLLAQTWQDFEVIHVDSNSSDQTVSLSRQRGDAFEHHRIIEMKQRGVSLGRNVGARVAQSERLLFLDADTRLDADFLQAAMTEITRRNLACGIVRMDPRGLRLLLRVGYEAFNLGITLTSWFFPTAIGACLFSTRTAHIEIGGFDERLSLCEDCDYVLRISRSRARFGLVRARFRFDPRRLEQDGVVRTGLIYLRANLVRFIWGELYETKIDYAFGHYRGPFS